MLLLMKKLLLLAAITSIQTNLVIGGNLRDPSTVEEKNEQKRPKIYTFFEMKLRRDGVMDWDGKHDEMIDHWTNTWTRRGWDARILTLEDAKKHRDFQKYSDIIMRLTPDKSFIYGGSYNYMCLMRWLAVAAQGEDAFMSDYDTFPFHIKPADGLYLPNGGKFTVYDRFVPSLMSGSAEEWDRLAIGVVERVLKHFQTKGFKARYSDMYSLESLWLESPDRDKFYISERKVESYPYEERGKLDCDRTQNTLALHLSHDMTQHAVEDGLISDEYHEKNRYKMFNVIMHDWTNQCAPQDEPQREKKL